jgi:hypothetical protein
MTRLVLIPWMRALCVIAAALNLSSAAATAVVATTSGGTPVAATPMGNSWR